MKKKKQSDWLRGVVTGIAVTIVIWFIASALILEYEQGTQEQDEFRQEKELFMHSCNSYHQYTGLFICESEWNKVIKDIEEKPAEEWICDEREVKGRFCCNINQECNWLNPNQSCGPNEEETVINPECVRGHCNTDTGKCEDVPDGFVEKELCYEHPEFIKCIRDCEMVEGSSKLDIAYCHIACELVCDYFTYFEYCKEGYCE